MPRQDRVWRDDRGNSLQNLSAERSPSGRESASLVISQAQSPTAGFELYFQDAVLFDQVVDHARLLAANPAREYGQE